MFSPIIDSIIFLIIGLALLVWSADKLVYGSAAIAKNVGISPLVIGMTIIAMGSSAPEMVVSATAALGGKTDTAVGNILGSNIANIALILGLTALVKPLSISSSILRRELPLMLGVTLCAGFMLWDNYLSFIEGCILAVLFIIFILTMMKFSKNAEQSDPLLQEQESEIPANVPSAKAIFWVVAGMALLIYSAGIVVDASVVIAKSFGMSDLVIGLTIVAVGTSLPELAASIAGVLKGEDDLAVGNIIGSNIFNILAVMALPAILAPSELNPLAMGRDFYIMLAISVLLLIFAVGKARTINRIEGILLLTCFVAYQGYLFTNVAA